ncbi:MAG: patatin-like phospholipase family protein [Proteobacteria bacterium]|nr:patatin-like phospholipase family protein [Pseudomonadota bacterium]
MLTIEPARRPRAARGGKLGIALAGGGPLGFFYELGALHAVGEAVVGRELTAFDVYVGVSSGALLAGGLANGLSTTTLGSMYLEDSAAGVPFSPGQLLQPAAAGYLRRIAQLPKALAHVARQVAKDPLSNAWNVALGSLGAFLPTALFDNRPLERHLRTLFELGGHADDFRKLPARLYTVATNLNTGESVAFGGPGHDQVAVSRAILASCALPGLYPAVEIGGQQYVDGALIRTMHASLALQDGCDLVLCVNPLVPFDASRGNRRAPVNLAALGLPAILGQTFRALIHSRMQLGMASYGKRFPSADTLLLEPDRSDERLLLANVFRYSGRQRLAEHAYQRTRRDLLAQADALQPLLERHGLRLDLRILRDRRRHYTRAAALAGLRSPAAAKRLALALGRLENVLAASGAPK